MTTPSASPPRSWKDIVIAMIAGATVVVLVVVVAGLGWRQLRPSTVLEVEADRVAFTVELPTGNGISAVTVSPPEGECPRAGYGTPDSRRNVDTETSRHAAYVPPAGRGPS